MTRKTKQALISHMNCVFSLWESVLNWTAEPCGDYREGSKTKCVSAHSAGRCNTSSTLTNQEITCCFFKYRYPASSKHRGGRRVVLIGRGFKNIQDVIYAGGPEMVSVIMKWRMVDWDKRLCLAFEGWLIMTGQQIRGAGESENGG